MRIVAHSSKALIQRELLDTIKELRATIEDLRKALADSQEREKVLQEQIAVMNKRLFGRSSEKHMTQSEGQIDFFNEIEMEADKTPEEEILADDFEETNPAPTEKQRKKRTLRRKCLKDLLSRKQIRSNCLKSSSIVINAAQRWSLWGKN
jgi:septal ring factor EnvC (AmiA/AmiB activator)